MREARREQQPNHNERVAGAVSPEAFTQVVFLEEPDVDIGRIGEALRAGSVVVIAPAPPTLHLTGPTETPNDTTRGDVDLQVEELHINLESHLVQWRGKTLDLTEQELQILAAFAKNPGRAFSFSELFEEVWHVPAYGHSDAIRSAVKRLRRKLGREGVTVQLDSVKGFGYRLGGR